MTRNLFLVLLILPLLFFFLVIPLSAQEVRQTAVKLLWDISQKEQFGSELYQMIPFFEKTITIRCLAKDQVVGVDQGGKLTSPVNLYPGQQAILSKDGRYIGVMTYTGKSEFIDSFELKAINGEVLSRIRPSRNFIDFLVGYGAEMIVGVSVENPPDDSIDVNYVYHFYDRGGKEIAQTKAVNPKGIAITPDGKAFVINDTQTGFKAFSSRGERMWNSEISYKLFDASNEAQQVIGNNIREINKVTLLRGGKILREDEFKSPVYNVAISPGGVSLLATGARTIRLYDGELKIRWEYPFEDKTLTITSVAVTNKGFVACGLLKDNGSRVESENRYTRGMVYLFDPGGKIIWNEEYDLGISNAWIPTVSLTPENDDVPDVGQRILSVQTRERLLLYEIQP